MSSSKPSSSFSSTMSLTTQAAAGDVADGDMDYDLVDEAAFFGRRKGKRLRAYQAGLIETLLPKLAVDVSKAIDPASLFSKTPARLVLEIGFGGGEHLVTEALRDKDTGFIGCEPFVNGMAKALACIADDDIGNIRLHMGDATDLINRLPDACLDQVYLLYPDPWPKRRQRKRRFVSDAMVEKLARVLKPGGEFRFATDIDDYSGWTLVRVMRSAHFNWPARQSSDWLNPWAGWRSTRYEQKAQREGRPSVYLTFLRS